MKLKHLVYFFLIIITTMSESYANSSFGKFTGNVGSKAGGFIAKKFFHPSSLQNQEKVWKNMEKAKEQEKKEEERQRAREEERQVDELRRQMMMRGQMKKEDDILKRMAVAVKLTDREQAAQAEHKKRLLALKKMDEVEAAASSSSAAPATMISSKYKEDHQHHGHKSVWGSFYDAETHKWGYACCKSLDKGMTCPYYNPEEEQSKKKKKKQRREEAEQKREEEERKQGGLQIPVPSPEDSGTPKSKETSTPVMSSRLQLLQKMYEEKNKKT